MKTILTTKESSHLIDLGVDAKLASGESLVGGALFTLTDLLSILPKEIDGNHLDIVAAMANLEKGKIEKGWSVTYVDDYSECALENNTFFSAPELIDALNQLAIWCLTEKKINLNQKEQ